MGAGRVALALTALLVGVTVALAVWHWRSPIADAALVEEAERETRETLREIEHPSCPRPVLRGAPLAGDASQELRELLAVGGPFEPCLGLVRARRIEIDESRRGEAGLDPRLLTEEIWAVADAFIELQVRGPSPGLRATTPDLEREVLAGCRGLDAAVERIVQHESVCTPFAVPDAAFDEDTATAAVVALGVLARDRVRRGEPRRGIELLLDALRLAEDLRRGHATTLVGWVSTNAGQVAIQDLSSLLGLELSWTRDDLLELERQASLLGTPVGTDLQARVDDDLPVILGFLETAGWARSAPSGVPRISEIDDLEQLSFATTWHLHRRLSHLCDGAATYEECRDRVAAEHASAETSAASWLVEVASERPRLFRAGAVRGSYPAHVEGVVHDLEMAGWREASVAGVVAQIIHRRLALDAGCPDASRVEGALRASGAFDALGGVISVSPTTFRRQPLRVDAPPWLAAAGSMVPQEGIAYLECPPVPIAPAAPTTEPPEAGR